MDETAFRQLLRRQSGVVSRQQVLERNGSDDDIERLLRRRQWATVHRGVYVGHTGPLTWDPTRSRAGSYHSMRSDAWISAARRGMAKAGEDPHHGAVSAGLGDELAGISPCAC